MMASFLPLRLFFGLIFVLITVPERILSFPVAEKFEDAEKFWVEHNCVFPAPSTFERNALRPNDAVLEICRSRSFGQENFVTILCSHFIKISKLLCNGSVSAFERQYLEESVLQQLVQNPTWNVCAAAQSSTSHKYVDFSYMTQDGLCEERCLYNSSIAPVCRLLVAVVVKYEEAFNEETRKSDNNKPYDAKSGPPVTNDGQSQTDSTQISVKNESDTGTKMEEHSEGDAGSKKTLTEVRGTAVPGDDGESVKADENKTVKPEKQAGSEVRSDKQFSDHGNNTLQTGPGTKTENKTTQSTTMKTGDVVDTETGNERKPLNSRNITAQVKTESDAETKANNPPNDGGSILKTKAGGNADSKTRLDEQSPMEGTTVKTETRGDTRTVHNGLSQNDGNQTAGGSTDDKVDEQPLKKDQRTPVKIEGVGDHNETKINNRQPQNNDNSRLQTGAGDNTKNETKPGAGDNAESKTEDGGDSLESTTMTLTERKDNSGTVKDDDTISKDLNSSSTTTSTLNPNNKEDEDPEIDSSEQEDEGEDKQLGDNLNDERIPQPPHKQPEAPVGRPVGINFEEDEPPTGHFMAYFLTAVVLCVAGYVVYHNKKKIMAFVLEGRRDVQQRRRTSGSTGGSSAKYHKLQPSVEEVMPSLEKSTTSKDYIY